MPIEFEGLPPYEPLFAVSAESAPSLDGVAFTVTIAVDGLPIDCVPITVLLEPPVARDLAAQLKVNADVVERWRNSSSIRDSETALGFALGRKAHTG